MSKAKKGQLQWRRQGEGYVLDFRFGNLPLVIFIDRAYKADGWRAGVGGRCIGRDERKGTTYRLLKDAKAVGVAEARRLLVDCEAQLARMEG